MNSLLTRLALAATLPLLPIALIQGFRLQKRIPKLPEAPEPHSGLVSEAGAPIHLLILGESTVAGVGAASHQQALSGRLAQTLAKMTQRSVHWRAVGETGATARKARLQLVPKLNGAAVDVVVIALGVNDVIRRNSPRRWSRDLRRFLEAVRRRTGPAPVFLAAVPAMGRFPAFPQPLSSVLGIRAKALGNAARRLACVLPGVTYVEPTPTLLSQDFFCPDGLHPSAAGYALWAAQLAEAIAPCVGSR